LVGEGWVVGGVCVVCGVGGVVGGGGGGGWDNGRGGDTAGGKVLTSTPLMSERPASKQ